MAEPKSAWQAFRRDRPGRRFTRRYERLRGSGHSLARRALRAVLGVSLVVVGAAFMVLPGPGIVPVVAGLALIAGDSRRMARSLDRAELRIRRWRRGKRVP